MIEIEAVQVFDSKTLKRHLRKIERKERQEERQIRQSHARQLRRSRSLPGALYSGFRESVVGRAINAAVPVLPMAPMPREARKNPNSAIAQEYIEQIKDNSATQLVGAVETGLIGTMATLLSNPNISKAVGALTVTLGIIMLNKLRIGVNGARKLYHEKRSLQAALASKASVDQAQAA